jgi:hypothetical protein
MDDPISRQAAISALWKALYEYEDKTERQFIDSEELDVTDWFQHRIFVQNMSDIDRQTIINLPPAQPERKKGKWIVLKHNHNAMCSNCYQTFVDAYDLENWDNYCRHCGELMEDMITEEEWDGI